MLNSSGATSNCLLLPPPLNNLHHNFQLNLILTNEDNWILLSEKYKLGLLVYFKIS